MGAPSIHLVGGDNHRSAATTRSIWAAKCATGSPEEDRSHRAHRALLSFRRPRSRC